MYCNIAYNGLIHQGYYRQATEAASYIVKCWGAVITAEAHPFKYRHTAHRSTLLMSTESGLLWGSGWDSELLELGFKKDFCSVTLNEPSSVFHFLYNTHNTTENPHTARDCAVKNAALASKTFTETQNCCFHLITSFHLSFIFTLCRHTAHIKLTLQCYLTGGANKGSMLGIMRTKVLHPMLLH